MTDYLPIQPAVLRGIRLFILSFFSFIILLFTKGSNTYCQKPYTPEITNPIADPWRWKHIPELVGKGLRCMNEASDGTFWFGVDSGVIRYNGIEWVPYNKNNGFVNIAVNSICISSDNKIYTGTDKGIYMFHKNKWTLIFPKLSDSSAFRASKIKCLRLLKNGTLLASIGTSNYTGLLVIRGNHQTLISSAKVVNRSHNKFTNLNFSTVTKEITPDDKFEIEEIFEDKENKIWFSTRHKAGPFLLFYARINEGESDSLIIEKFFTEKDGLKHGKYTMFQQTSDGTIWMINGDYNLGISQYNGKTWKYIKLSQIVGDDDLHTCIIETPDKKVWIGGMGNLYAYKNGNWEWYKKPNYAIPISRVNLFTDSKGFLWLLGKQNEIFRIDYSGKIWQSYKKINYQCETADGRKWFIAVDGRVVVDDHNTWYSYGPENGLPDAPVRLFLTKNSTLWAAGSNKSIASTAWFDGTKWNMQQHPYLSWGIDYRAVFEDKNNNLWFGCCVDVDESKGQLGGVLKLEKPNTPGQKWFHFDPRGSFKLYNAYGIGQSKDGTIWLGGSRLSKYNGQRWEQTDTAHSISTYYDNVINLPNGILWVGSRYYGIFGFDGEKWFNYNVNSGLPSNTIIYILPITDHNLIVATDNDFCRFDGKTWTKNIFPEQFILGREGGNLFSGKEGSIWINSSIREWKRRPLKNNKLTNEIIDNFYCIEYKPDKSDPITVIKDYSKEVSRFGNTTISWTGTDYWHSTPTNRLAYSYRLNDGEWTPFQERNYETFIGLKSGKYKLEVRSRDLDFNIDKTPAVAYFKVLPPIWKQAWFILLILAFICVIIVFQLSILKTSKELVDLNQSLKNAKTQLEEQKEQILEQIKTDRENYQQKIRFFTRISHEFRTPLTVISWITLKIKENLCDENNPNIKQYLRSLSRNSNYMLKLINQLMDFRKLEANSMELHISKGNIVKFIESIYGNFNSLANNYNISLDFYSNFPGNDSWFDADKIEKIVYNLVSNAVKFTPEFGKVKLSLIKEDDDQNHGKIFIIVEDTGIGIPDEEKEKIFEPFFQGRTVPLRKHEGTGIGLSLVKNLVELHHGKLHVKSAFKKQKSGKHDFTTSFSVEIPLNEENYVPSEIELREIDLPDIEIDEIFESEQIESSDNNERPSGLPLVLLVEDNEDLSQLVKDSFKGIYHVEWAKNGEEGYNKTIEILPNIIISDIMMPVLNGIEMCKKIKNNSSISHIPIILLTAKNTDDSQIEGYKAGADDYISKPFSIPILIARVKNLIESRDILRKKFRNELEINTIGKIVPIKEKDFMQKVLDIIEQNISNSDFDVESLSREVGVSSRHLLNKIQSLTDYTPVEFIRTIRLKKAEQLLLNTKLTISEVAYDVGFADPNYFGKCFQKHFGKSPKEFLASKIHS